jgi:adenylate kinase family enzyme
MIPLMIILMLGGPGSGKGTQAQILARETHASHVSTGDLLRRAAIMGSPLGIRVKELIEAGKLVPDEIMIQVVEEILPGLLAKGSVILDGFPRTLGQAQALELHLKKKEMLSQAQTLESFRKKEGKTSQERELETFLDEEGVAEQMPALGAFLKGEETVEQLQKLEVFLKRWEIAYQVYHLKGYFIDKEWAKRAQVLKVSLEKEGLPEQAQAVEAFLNGKEMGELVQAMETFFKEKETVKKAQTLEVSLKKERMTEQAQVLETFLKWKIISRLCVLYFEVDPAILKKRILNRVSCSSCETIGSLKEDDGTFKCHFCGSEKYVRRQDDTEETVQKRIEQYNSETAPVIEFYREQGVLKTMDGAKDKASIAVAVKEAVESF